MPHWTGPLPRTQAKLVRAEQMLDDGCSYREIHRTLGIHVRSLREAFPNRGWTQSEGGKLAMLMRKLDRENPYTDFKYGNQEQSVRITDMLEDEPKPPREALSPEQRRERNAQHDRDYQRNRRAQMTPEQRATERKAWDAKYREVHGDERRASQREYNHRVYVTGSRNDYLRDYNRKRRARLKAEHEDQ